MRFPTVDKFFGCGQLKTGVLVIGSLHLIGALLACVVLGLVLGGCKYQTRYRRVGVVTCKLSSHLDNQEGTNWEHAVAQSEIRIYSSVDKNSTIGVPPATVDNNATRATPCWGELFLFGYCYDQTKAVLGMGVITALLASIWLLIGLVNVISASLLIHGARKGRAGLLVPQMIVSCIGLAWTLVDIIIRLVRLEEIAAFAGIIGFSFESYFLVVIWSFRLLLIPMNKFINLYNPLMNWLFFSRRPVLKGEFVNHVY